MAVPEGFDRELERLRWLERAGVPVFAALLRHEADAKGKLREKRHLPRWERLVPGCGGLDRATSEMAFGAVTGHVLDVVDVDPKNGGSVDEIRRGLAEADVYVLAEVGAPSDGVHFHIPATGLPTWRGKGVDFLGGTAEGESRAFAYVPPTIRPKYPTGGYRWLKEPEYHLLGKIRPEPAIVFVQRLHDQLGRPRAHSTFGQPGGVAVGHRGADLWVDRVAKAAEHERNVTLNDAAFYLAAEGLLTVEVEEDLLDAATGAGLGLGEARDTIRSASDAIGRRRDAVEDWLDAVRSDPEIGSSRHLSTWDAAYRMAELFVGHGDGACESSRQLAEVLGVSHQTAARGLGRLVDRGWLDRTSDGRGRSPSYAMAEGYARRATLTSLLGECRTYDTHLSAPLGHDAFIRIGTAALPRGSADTLAAAMAGHDTVASIATATGFSRPTVRRHLHILESTGSDLRRQGQSAGADRMRRRGGLPRHLGGADACRRPG